MDFYRCLADVENGADFLVALPGNHGMEYVDFARSQIPITYSLGQLGANQRRYPGAISADSPHALEDLLDGGIFQNVALCPSTERPIDFLFVVIATDDHNSAVGIPLENPT